MKGLQYARGLGQWRHSLTAESAGASFVVAVVFVCWASWRSSWVAYRHETGLGAMLFWQPK